MNLFTIVAKEIKRYLAGAALSVLAAGFGMTQPARADVFWGANAGGTATQFEITCGTCPNPVTTLSSTSDGGFGDNSAAVSFSEPNEVTYFGTAVFTGPRSLPHLGVLVSTNIVTGGQSTFFYAAGADARGTQQYTYRGSTPMDYTLEYDINGEMLGGILTEIAGGFTVFGAGFVPGKEIEPVLGFSFDHVNGDGTEKPVRLNGAVSFSVNPGDTVFVQATLDAFADSRSDQLPALADASHTLEMSFTQGDPSLLIPAATTVSAVPEPATTVLTGMGIAALVIRVRRRRSLS